MATRTLTLEVPEELIRLVGWPEAAATRLLGRTRWDVLELMGKYQVESGPETVEESRREIEVARRFLKGKDGSGGRQQ